ncbi:MAG: hypothetical protein F6K65_35845 [Moorea sp. SIO3C2]|nr:hypothetical protein [Moorena sp. SIO3C2]
MVETIQAKDVTLKQLKTLVNLQLVNDNQFFHEWQENLPEISELQQTS